MKTITILSIILIMLTSNVFALSTNQAVMIDTNTGILNTKDVINGAFFSNNPIPSCILPTIITSVATITLTKTIINSALNGEFNLHTTNTTYLTIDITTFLTNDACSFAIGITGTNPISVNTSVISSSMWNAKVWTNSVTVPNDCVFRKASGSMIFGIR